MVRPGEDGLAGVPTDRKGSKHVAEFADQSQTQQLMREMGVNDQDILRRKKIVALEREDLANIAAI